MHHKSSGVRPLLQKVDFVVFVALWAPNWAAGRSSSSAYCSCLDPDGDLTLKPRSTSAEYLIILLEFKGMHGFTVWAVS